MSRHDDAVTVELSGATGAELVLAVTAGGRVRTLRLPPTGELTIGRSRQCDVQIEDAGVSGKHATLRVAPLAIKDNDSRNGLWLRGRRLDPGVFVELSTRDVVEIGGGFLTVRPARGPARPRRIWPHDYLEGRIDEECARHARGGAGFVVIRLRAPAGADPRAVESLLADSVRTEDVLARYAADDYEVMVVGVDAAQGEAAAARLLQELADGLGCARGSIAAGVAVVGRDGSSADELITAAAAALAGEPSSPVAPQIVPGSQLEAVVREITRVAASELPVLVLGETGTGKELCAEAVHRLSPRHGAPLLRLNCAAFPAELLEAELFGYERGAFTGAAHAKPGLLETAAGGTVFIDEVGELSPSTQVKLLRVLERREVQRIGALAPTSIDVRFVAATHRDLDAEIAAGRFRQDLYFRIAGYTVHVPPLRARADEIAPLARHFAARAAEAAGRPAPELTADALALLAGYPWPGNVRELRNVIERAVVLAGRGAIRPEHLPTDKFRSTVLAPARPRRVTEAVPPPAFDVTAPVERFEVNELVTEVNEFASGPPTMPTLRAADLRADFRERERAAILRALEECAGNQTRAAQQLGISRGTLVSKLDAYGVPRPRKPR